jgi:putative ABC transport system permease protein
MFKNYLLVTIRNLRKQKTYAFINIIGFAVGMAACILIVLYVLNELSYDKFLKNADRIYRIGVEGNLSGNYVKYPISNLGTGPTMLKDFPEVESFTRFYSMDRVPVKYQDKNFFEERLAYVDPQFFEVFSFPLLQGDSKTALVNAYSIVITRGIAKKYFGNENPLNKQLRLNNNSDYTVTAVIENIPQNSHLKFDFLTSIETYYIINNRKVEEWTNFSNYTYFLLKKDIQVAQLTKKFPGFINQYLATMVNLLGGDLRFFLQPVTDIHLYSNLGYEMPGNSDIAYIYVFSSIAFFILLIACINFMNLATARSTSRAKEIGVRKILGADKRKLIKQFLAESMMYSTISMLLALLLVRLVTPYFSSLSGNDLSFHLKEMPWLIPVFISFTFFTGLLAGIYPALFLSAFEPILVIKKITRAGSSSSRFRKVLVISQFIISINLIIGSSVMFNQLNFMKNKKLGFNKEHVVVIPIMDSSIRSKIESIKNELKSYSSVISISSTSDVPGNNPDYSAFIPEGYTTEQTQLLHRINCDSDFIPTMGMELVSGRNFSQDFSTDAEEATIINETAARTYGWDNPLGKKIGYFTNEEMNKLGYRTVIGLVKDFHVKSLHEKILPLLLTNNQDYLEEIAVRIRPEGLSGTLDFLEKKWKDYDSGRPFDYYFLDQSFDAQYQSDRQLNKIIGYFSLFAIFVACLGLYGMTSFMTEQRFKEIGIRKTLGASIPSIIILLTKEVTKLILLAAIIAIPVSYYFLQRWLEGFAYRTGIGITTYVISTIIVLFIGYTTIAYQSIRAALINPVKAIRIE